MIAAMADIMA